MRLIDAKTEADVAAFFRENGERIREARARRAEAGEPSGPLPLGYRYETVGFRKRAVLDPEKLSLVRQMFVMAAAGYPIRRIIREVTAVGLTSRHGKPLGPSSVLKVLRNPFYAGLITNKGELATGKHPPLVEPRMWLLTQRNLDRKRRKGGKS